MRYRNPLFRLFFSFISSASLLLLFLFPASLLLLFLFPASLQAWENEAAKESIALEPLVEGLYEITMECRDIPASQDCIKLQASTRMVIVNLGAQKYGAFGTLITIMNPKVEVPLYELAVQIVKNGGTYLIGNADNLETRPVEILFEFNKTSGEILAWLRDAQFQSDIKITGRQIITLESVYKTASPQLITLTELQGTYEGGLPGVPGYLSIRPTLSGNPPFFSAFVSEVGSKLYSESAQFLPQRGILKLNFGMAKWTFAISYDSENNLHLDGIGISAAAARSYPLSFVKRSTSKQGNQMIF